MKFFEKLKAACKADDPKAVAAVLDQMIPDDEDSKPETHVHIHTRDEEKKDDEDDKDKDKDKDKTRDAAIDKRFKDVEDTLDAHGKDIKAIKDAVVDEKKDDDDDDDDDKTEDEKLEFEAEAPPGTGDKAYAVRDSVYLEDSFQETVALAEIIAPGIGVPTFDRKADRKKTYDALCGFRRKVLDTADRDPDTHVVIDRLTGGRPLAALKRCADVRTIFRAVGEFKKSANNASATRDAGYVHVSGGGNGVRGSVRTPAELNKRMSEIYKTT